MFNMTKIRASNASGKSFYANHLSSNDYYSEHEKVQGYWRGKLAEAFGLYGGVVTSEEFSLFQKNVNPLTLGKLTQKNMPNGPRFFDFQCAATKSVSVMSLFDERLMRAHLEAVREAMEELEHLAAARVRSGENVRTNNYETTGKLVYAEFTHDTSRSLDPQIHTHNVVCNVTLTDEGKYKALETLEMCRAIRYAGKVYHNALAKKCQELGYDLVEVRDRKGNVTWCDLRGVPDDVMKRFSKRREEIESAEAEFIAEYGRKPTLSENNAISMATRSEKMKTSTKQEVLEYQMEQLSRQEKEQLFQLAEFAKALVPTRSIMDAEKTTNLVRRVIDELYERESVLKQDKILAEVLNRNLGRFDLKTLKDVVKDIPELRNLGGDTANPYYSPEVVIERELTAINSVDQQRGIFEAIAPDFTAFPGKEERAKQAELIHGLLCSKDRFNLFRGVAGAGKTSTLQEFCKGLRSGGVENIYLVAPTNSATDVLKQEGFAQSQTVASFLLSPQKPPQGSYVIIDESGLNSLREGVEILKLARQNDYRVLFVGDARQHTAVESGDFFRLLEDYSQIQKFSLTDIHRQQHEEYRRGIFECAIGQYEQAFERFDKQHFIHEDKQDYLNEAAERYMAYTEQGQFLNRAILVAPTHDECDKLTDAVRDRLKKTGTIRGKSREVEVFRSLNKPKTWLRNAENYQEGMTIGFIRNMNGVANAGEMVTVHAIENEQLVLSNGKRIFAKNASDFIDVGETRKIELCPGDLIQFRVNLKSQKIYNGTLARVCNDPGKIELLSVDGQPYRMIDMPQNYGAYDYGWVTTSHKSQGRTAENVVVAAESMDRKAFYVALSRGRKEMSLHCPDKEYLKRALAYRTGERTTIHDLIRDREIPANAILPLSDEARARKAETLPDTSYKDIRARMKATLRKAKAMLSDTAMIRRMRKHRERLFDEHYRVESEGFAVALVGKVVNKISGLFKKPEPPKEEVPDLKTEILAQEREAARQAEIAALWKIAIGARNDYVEKRKAYHEQYGGGKPFKLTKREIAFNTAQDTRRAKNELPFPLPDWMINWEETAQHEAEKSRAALMARLEDEKCWKAAWEKADASEKSYFTARKAYHAELGIKAPFKLWNVEETYLERQEQCRREHKYPLPLPDVKDWKNTMKQQRARELKAMWSDSRSELLTILDARKEYYEDRHVGDEFKLWQREKDFIALQDQQQTENLEPLPIPAEIRNWQNGADEEIRRIIEEQTRQREIMLRDLWQDFERQLEQTIKAHNAYRQEFEPELGEYQLRDSEKRDIELQYSSRDMGIAPEYPDWMLVDWKAKADARRDVMGAWKEFDENWKAHLERCQEYTDTYSPGTKYELFPEERTFMQTQEKRRANLQYPQSLAWLDDWKKKADAKRALENEWKKFDAKKAQYLDARRPYMDEYYPGQNYESAPLERIFFRDQEKLRAQGKEPENFLPFMQNWREIADAKRQQEYEAKSLQDWKWQKFDEIWAAYELDVGKLNTREKEFLREMNQFRAAHKEPPENLPGWLHNEAITDLYWWHKNIEAIRKELGIHPGDEYNPVDPVRKKIYESKKAELKKRIADFDRKEYLGNLPKWLQDRNPSEYLKDKILHALYLKHGYDPAWDNVPAEERSRSAEKARIRALQEFEDHEDWLNTEMATPEQLEELEEFVLSGYIESYSEDLSMDDADRLLDDLREQAEQNRQKMQMERLRYPMEDWQEKVLTKLHRRGHLPDVPTYFSYYEANDLIDECRRRGMIRSYEIEDIKNPRGMSR